MFWISKVVAPLALAVGVAVAAAVVGAEERQPNKDDKKRAEKRPDEKKSDDRKGPPDDKRGPAPRPDATVDAWVKVLIEKITDPHDVVRDSARGALVAVGPQAIPALQKLAEGGDEAKAVAARKVIEAIQHRGDHPHGPGPQGPNHPGFGPRGPMGPMGPRGPMGPMGPGRPGEPGAGLERIFGGLQLSEKQQKQVQEVMQGFARRMHDFATQLRDGKIERKDVPEAMEKLQKELLADVKKVLDDEQFKKLQERLPDGRLPIPGPFGPGDRPNQPNRPERE